MPRFSPYLVGDQHTFDFIQLNRAFRELSLDAGGDDNVEAYFSFLAGFTGKRMGWPELLQEFRVIILSEAGAGKTKEIYNIAQELRKEGKAAFFLRLEHIPNNFELAFEVGTFEEFTAWLSSDEEGWLLLDSIDEARLRHPGDFETAVRVIGTKITGVLQKTHIILTGRVSAWRPNTDLALCMRCLPYTSTPPSSTESEMSQAASGFPHRSQPAESNAAQRTENNSHPWKFVALGDLSPEQIEIFAFAKGVQDTQAFLRAVERVDAWQFTSRPQDLEELVGFWNKKHQIGSRLEIMEASVKHRLEEWDQNRKEHSAAPSSQCIRKGARLVAAAVTLGKESTIRVPDNRTQNSQGLCINELLQDWQDIKLGFLLSRPIFDGAIYGTVRFHHRSVQEYLTAEWLNTLLQGGAPRRNIESLLFCKQHDLNVIVPAMRPVLPWLALLDSKICGHMQRVAPEVFFEGGDPAGLPLETRRTILKQVCEQIAAGIISIPGYEAVKRFASAELGSDVKALLSQYAMNNNVVWLLLGLVEQGNLQEALPEAKKWALSPATSEYTRITAFRAIQATGSPQDIEEVRTAFFNESDELKRRWLAELVDGLKPTQTAINWLLAALAKSETKEEFHHDGLQEAVTRFIRRTETECLPAILVGLHKLLDTSPLLDNLCRVSQRFSWLLNPAMYALECLAEAHSPFLLQVVSLDLLHKAVNSSRYGGEDNDIRKINKKISSIVPIWPELNRALFWHDAKMRLLRLHENNSEEKIGYSSMLCFNTFWQFGAGDFDYALEQILAQELPSMKFLALSMAFRFYTDGGREQQQLKQLKKAVEPYADLAEILDQCLFPPVQEKQEWMLEHEKRQEQAAAEERQRKENRDKWVLLLRENPDRLRHNGLTPGKISKWQYCLHQEVEHLTGGNSRPSLGNWQCLIEEFGKEVAEAYRDGAIGFWHNHVPKLYSEGAPGNSIPREVIFGLAGLYMEAESVSDWPASLTPEEAERACRYAVYELDGLPDWFQALFTAFPDIVGNFLLKELRYELSVEQKETRISYVLSKIRWHATWTWKDLSCPVFRLLEDSEPANVWNLDDLLIILQGSSVSDEEIAGLAAKKIQSSLPSPHMAHWFSLWIGVEPEKAIPALTKHLEHIADATDFAIQVAISLDKHSRPTVVTREAFHAPEWLKQLYLLMHRYIRVDEDIRRENTGVYSPTSRDNAQDAREVFASLLQEIPGKETFLALQEIAKIHPVATFRNRYLQAAKSRAEQDADLKPWKPSEIREFHDKQEKTPCTALDLAELAVSRLLDLKDTLENGDDSIVKIMKPDMTETEMRNFIGRELREKDCGRYRIAQEEELADGKKPDLRFHGIAVDAVVPVELKLADRWSGSQLLERMENQLCGDYLRDRCSSYGIFLLVNRGNKRYWEFSESGERVDFQKLVSKLEKFWAVVLVPKFPEVDRVDVVGIDLTERMGIPVKSNCP